MICSTHTLHFELCLSFLFILKKIKYLLFQSSFRLIVKLKGRYREFPYPPKPPPHASPAPLATSPTRVVYLLQLMNLHSHIITIQSPQCTLVFTPIIVHSMGLDKHVTMCIHHYGIIESVSTALHIFVLHVSIPLSLPQECFKVHNSLRHPVCLRATLLLHSALVTKR